MVESKSVKVDNWGVFFLQKLQHFFNKTDYCDLTLSFMDNTQLKVHRLVLSACTDYFNVLEQQCDSNDDILVMPDDLQADVVVPIVNFMYTGTLEFEVSMYARLLKTAKDMHMTVLLKLLEAHKRTVEVRPVAGVRAAPVLLNKGAQRSNAASHMPRPGGVQHRRLPVSPPVLGRPRGTVEAVVRKVGGVAQRPTTSTPTAPIRGPARFEANEESSPDQFESSFDNISYESRPPITANRTTSSKHSEQGFEQLRKGYTGVKRPASSLRAGSESPPEKKPNIEDVKEYTEAAKLRKKIAEEYEEDDDEESGGEDMSSNEAHIGAKLGVNRANSAMIVNEVFKKYPHLLKNNKNIKLKISKKSTAQVAPSSRPSGSASGSSAGPSSSSTPKPTTTNVTSAIAVYEKNTVRNAVINAAEPVAKPSKIDVRSMHALIAKGAENTTGPWLCLRCGVNGRPISIPSYKGFRRHLIHVHKQKIDPKLCEHCGWRSNSKEELHHHILVIHNLNPPANMKFPRCGDCSFVGIDAAHLKTHVQEKHETDKYSDKPSTNVQHCIYCNRIFTEDARLFEHMRLKHRDRAREDGVMDSDSEDLGDEDDYVPNLSASSGKAKESGNSSSGGGKFKILSDISLPGKAPYLQDSKAPPPVKAQPPSSEAEGLSNVATGIAASLGILEDDTNMEEDNSSQNESNLSTFLEDEMALVHGEVLKDKPDGADDGQTTEGITQFVGEEGAAVELTEEQRAELLQQLQDQSIMIINEDGLSQDKSEGTAEEPPVESDSNTADGSDAAKDQSMEEESKEAVGKNETVAATSEKPSVVEPTATTSSAAAETKKLIVGDWSDDEEELFNETVKSEKSIDSEPAHVEKQPPPTVQSPETIAVAQKPTRSYKRSISSSNGKETAAKDVSHSQDSGIEVSKSSGKEMDVEISVTQVEDTQPEVKVEEEEEEEMEQSAAGVEATGAVPDIDEPKTDEEELKKASKIEIKTLINDWGDDDDDDE